ncbi:MAG: universal stress protein [Thalassospira sp.]|uniref:universal stress protein n=1 Tax=Thalassospira sp. TaxID=1912094 RepID=UPI0032EC0306
MYQKMLVPVDLAHIDIQTVIDLALRNRADINALSVVVHSPKEFGEKSAKFVTTRAHISAEPAIDLLLKVPVAKAGQLNTDLNVMAGHVPGVAGQTFTSHG